MSSNSTEDFDIYLGQYDWPEGFRVEHGESGMNNTTRMVRSGSQRYVLRVYNNHQDMDKVRVEHAILSALGGSGMEVRVPEPVLNRDLDTVTCGPDGKLASLFRFIDGQRPGIGNERQVLSLGQAAGKLTLALSRLEPDFRQAYSPYYSLEANYGYLDEPGLLGMAERSQVLSRLSPAISALDEERKTLIRLYNAFERLPMQWIHGDIVFNNAVADGDKVIALLDFEFCTQDARAMELAVTLPELIGRNTERSLQLIGLYCQGYGREVKLTDDEVGLLPDLMKLRMMDVYLHFAGRLQQRMDPEPIWAEQIERAAYVCGWINLNKEALMQLFQRHLMPVIGNSLRHEIRS
ncbi:phosphotransferase [Paenibacillus tarimensis]